MSLILVLHGHIVLDRGCVLNLMSGVLIKTGHINHGPERTLIMTGVIKVNLE